VKIRDRGAAGDGERIRFTSAIFADNKIALNAGWDLEILQLELGELASIDVDIDPTLTGFSTGEIDVILTSRLSIRMTRSPSVPMMMRHLSPKSLASGRRTEITWLCQSET
jgi:hypothetical protein